MLAALRATVFDRRKVRPVPARPDGKALSELACELFGGADEASGLDSAAAILSGYASLDDAGRLAFFRMMAVEMNISPDKVRQALDAYEALPSKITRRDCETAAEPPRQELIRRLKRVPGATGGVVEVALMRGIARSIQALLAEGREVRPAEEADTAVFYSISNCQPGLAGISFGNSLIKQVAADLSHELPELRTFVTLSPLPGFAKWLAENGIDAGAADGALLCALGAHYLVHAKYRSGMPVDPVARFHLGNGAIVHQVHAWADTSAKGKDQSAGVMVSYLYDLDCVAQNHERFATKGEIALSSQVRALCAVAEKALQPAKKA
jgi:malonyl-CoA decarboxylase